MKVLSCMFLLLIFCWSCTDESANDYTQTEIFESAWSEIDRNYSFFEDKAPDWDSIHSEFSKKVSNLMTDRELSDLIGEMLDILYDGHTNLYAPYGITGNEDYFTDLPINEVDSILQYFDHYVVINQNYDWAKIKGQSIFYLKIKSFDGTKESIEEIQTLLDEMSTGELLIVDVRGNRGGLISNVEMLLSNFLSENLTVLQYRYRNGANHLDFTEWITWTLYPYQNESYNDLKIAILTSKHTYSASEWFVAAMKEIDNTMVIGDYTGGGSGRPIIRELPNGWILRISNSQVKMESGVDFQNTGIAPDQIVRLDEAAKYENQDLVLEEAVRWLQN